MRVRWGWAVKQALLGLMLVASTFMAGYFSGRLEGDTQRAELVGKVQQHIAQEQALLEELTIERDEKQAKLDKLIEERDRKDAQAEAEIDRLNHELDSRPIRVRVVASGNCSGSAQAEPDRNADTGAGNATEAIRVLPDSNSRRLGIALKEVETLSAAYNSCRATLKEITALGGI